MMTTREDTPRVMELTPAGRGAVAVVLVAGPEAVQAVDACFHAASGKWIANVSPQRILCGRWGSVVGEELVVCRRSDDEVEVHCHGGVAAVRAVMERLVEQGCKAVQWQDWPRESELDPVRAEARIALADAPTERTASVLLDQFEGALSAVIVQALDAVGGGDWDAAARGLDALLGRGELGLHLTKPWRVVFAGRPNVGKSSLMNALVGFQRAIVCEVPGTTRDVVTANTAIDGWPVQLADTAGLRETGDEIESEGVARASAAAGIADLVLWVADSLDGFDACAPRNERVLRILNKVDLLPDSHVSSAGLGRYDLAVSALTGAGIAELIDAIDKAIVPSPPRPGEAVPFTSGQIARLNEARAAIQSRDVAAASNVLSLLLRR